VEVNSWVHLFVDGLSDVIVESLPSGADWIKEHLGATSMPIKGPEWIHETMQYYRDAQFPSDIPMLELAETSEKGPDPAIRAILLIDTILNF